MKDKSDTVSVAVALATTTAKQAADLASTAVKTATELASKTAETTAVIGTNMEWMKKSLEGIESKLNEMDKAFVTAAQHAELVKRIDEFEVRINVLEISNTRLTVMLVIGSSIMTFLTGLLVFHLFQAK